MRRTRAGRFRKPPVAIQDEPLPVKKRRTQVSASGLSQLQRAAGNGAVSRMVAGTGEHTIQRFSNQDLGKNEIDWNETIQVKRSGEGKTTGVYFFRSAGGTLVVKPEFGQRPESQMFGEKMLSRLAPGVELPTTVPVDKQSAEGASIRAQMLDPNKLVTPEGEQAQAWLEKTRSAVDDAGYFVVMSSLSGKSLHKTIEEANTPEKVEALANFFSDGQMMARLGMLIMVDDFAGNGDRLHDTITNIGNVMITETGVGAIDSSSFLPEFDEANFRRMALVTTASLGVDKARLDKAIDNLYGAVEDLLSAVQGCDALGIWKEKLDRANSEKLLRAGIQFAHQNIMETFEDREQREKIKKDVKKTYLGKNRKDGSLHWNSLKIKQFAWKLKRDHPELDDDTIEARVRDYAKYRVKRKKAVLKFLVKKPN